MSTFHYSITNQDHRKILGFFFLSFSSKYLRFAQLKKLDDKSFVIIIRHLKELQNYKRKLFLCPPQKQTKTQPTF